MAKALVKVAVAATSGMGCPRTCLRRQGVPERWVTGARVGAGTAKNHVESGRIQEGGVGHGPLCRQEGAQVRTG